MLHLTSPTRFFHPRAGESATAALHPYCAALTHECRATLSVINIRGEERFVANEAFATTFFHQDEANRLLSQEVRAWR